MDTQITITISERNGELQISAAVPESAANTVAQALAHQIMAFANELMNRATSQDREIVKAAQH